MPGEPVVVYADQIGLDKSYITPSGFYNINLWRDLEKRFCGAILQIGIEP